MKNQYSLKLIGALMALSGLGMNVQAQSINPPPKVRNIVNQLRYRAHIPSVTVGDTLRLHLRAAASDTFTLSIVDTGNVVVLTSLVTGGTTNLAALPIGKYSFTLSRLDSTQVGSGHFAVKAPRVSSSVRSGTLGDTLNIFVKADSSETFTLAISDTSGVIETVTVTGGRTALPALAIGRYTYTLTNADGLQVGTGHFAVKAPRVFATVKSVTLGDTLSIWVKADSTESFTLTISDTSGIVSTLTVRGGSTDLPALPIGAYSYTLTNADNIVVNSGRFAVKAPRVYSHVRSVVYGDTLSVFVRADSAATFTLEISDTSGVVQTLNVTGGSTDLPALAIGKYTYTLSNADGIVVSRGGFAVKAPRVASTIRSEEYGDTLTVYVKADSSESFTLVIADTSGAAVQTLTVSGGATDLPLLAIGKYTYTLTNADGIEVSSGRFAVKAPHVHASIITNRYSDSLRIVVLASASQTFTLTIYDTAGVVVQTTTVSGGASALAAVPAGKYTFTLVNADGIEVEHGKFTVRTPLVRSSVFPNPSAVGEGSITIDADASEQFTLEIYGASATPVYTATVSGGTTPLPDTLATGIYHYKVLNADGAVVSKGRILIVL